MIIAKDLWTDCKNGRCTWLCRISINFVKPFVYLFKPLWRSIFVNHPIQLPINLSSCTLKLRFSLQDNHNIVSRSTTGEHKPQCKQCNKMTTVITLQNQNYCWSPSWNSIYSTCWAIKWASSSKSWALSISVLRTHCNALVSSPTTSCSTCNIWQLAGIPSMACIAMYLRKVVFPVPFLPTRPASKLQC